MTPAGDFDGTKVMAPTEKLAGYERRSRFAASLGFGSCFRCGHGWQESEAWTETKSLHEPHVTTYNDRGFGIFPLCESCWSDLTPEERLPYYYELMRSNSLTPPELGKIEQVRTAVLAGG
jgi:hypothetical protein